MRFIGFLFFVLVSTTCALPTSPSQHAPSDSGREIEVGPRAAPPKKLEAADYTFLSQLDPKDLATIRTHSAYTEELARWSIDLVEKRFFEQLLGVENVKRGNTQVKPIHDPKFWSWRITTKDAAVISSRKHLATTSEWSLVSSADAKNLPLSEIYTVIPTPCDVSMHYVNNEIKVRFYHPSSEDRRTSSSGYAIPSTPEDAEMVDGFKSAKQGRSSCEEGGGGACLIL
ncbi:hypothetical protein F5878DRAFT_309481 [Lentinula raphanica]|uniref:Amine oxidase n=1 Tax=Lentinula raphanica TaxID=153919 RepID=A0AA38P3C7_9AGAR|nr:hypothetical protein F5878DRAFT_309481 [Lentinula raphanica]